MKATINDYIVSYTFARANGKKYQGTATAKNCLSKLHAELMTKEKLLKELPDIRIFEIYNVISANNPIADFLRGFGK